MFITVTSFTTVLGDDLQPGVNAKTLVGEYRFTFAVDNLSREILNVDTTREEQGGIEVAIFGEFHCSKFDLVNQV
jgi:hypothetical protein